MGVNGDASLSPEELEYVGEYERRPELRPGGGCCELDSEATGGGERETESEGEGEGDGGVDIGRDEDDAQVDASAK